MKIGIYCDDLLDKSGSPRIVIDIANKLKADLIISGYNPKVNEWIPIEGKIIDLGNFTAKFSTALGYYIETPLRFLFAKKLDYDIYIFYGVYSFYAAQKNKTNIWYCYSPNRLIYDLREWKLKKTSFIGKIFFKTHIFLFSKLDQYFIKNRVQKIVSLSKPVKDRIKKYYNLDSTVIYYGLKVNKFSFNKIGDFYLAVSRLTVDKRMDLIARAFKKIKDKKIIMVGDGPLKKAIEQIAKTSENIILLSNVSEKKLIDLYSNCLAVVYMPKDEDFGLVPLEANSSGKFCISANEGGCKDTVIDKKTGYLIDPTENELIKTIKKIDVEFLYKQKNTCINNAKRFDDSINLKKWDLFLKYFNYE